MQAGGSLTAAVVLGASALVAGCGGSGQGGSEGKPSWSEVKRVALRTPPMSRCHPATEIAIPNPGPGGGPRFAFGRALRCGSAPPDVGYRAYRRPADAQRFVREQLLDRGTDPYFVNGGLVVFLVEGAAPPSPLADRLRQQCGCGEVHRAGRRGPQPPRQ